MRHTGIYKKLLPRHVSEDVFIEKEYGETTKGQKVDIMNSKIDYNQSGNIKVKFGKHNYE